MAVKQVGRGDAAQVALLEEYVAATLYQEAQPNRTHFLQAADDQIRLSQLWWDDDFNDPKSAKGRAATAAAPGLSRVCRGCWQPGAAKQTRCSWMDCWSEALPSASLGPQ